MTRRLHKAVARHFQQMTGFDGEIDVALLHQRDWASVTFTGSQLKLKLTFDGPGAVGAAAELLTRLDAVEFYVPGHIVADIDLVSEARSDGGRQAVLELEILTIESN